MSKTFKLTLAAAALITAATLAAPAAMARGAAGANGGGSGGGADGGGDGYDRPGGPSAPIVAVVPGTPPERRKPRRRAYEPESECNQLIPVLEIDRLEVERCKRLQ